MAYDPLNAHRVRALLPGTVVEKQMMGGLVFMVGGHMCCAVKDSSLMVRVGPADRNDALARPHTRKMEFGGRSPTGFIYVDTDGFATDDALAGWVRRGLDFVATLPPKVGKTRRKLSARA